MRPRLFLSAAFAFGALFGCKHDAPVPIPQCYPGIVLQNRCNDGLLIQVDAQYRIGKSIDGAATDLLPTDGFGNDNVVAAVNDDSLGSFKRGQRIYFTYENDPKRQFPARTCFVFGPLVIPHLVLSNVSATPCTAL